MSNQTHFDRLGVPLSERPGHTGDCPHFEQLYPWQCDCQERAAASSALDAEITRIPAMREQARLIGEQLSKLDALLWCGTAFHEEIDLARYWLTEAERTFERIANRARRYLSSASSGAAPAPDNRPAFLPLDAAAPEATDSTGDATK